MLTFLKVLIYGIVEGITEWMPISSTGHLLLLEKILPLGLSESFMSLFRVVLQLGAILAVVIVYFRRLWPFQSAEERGEQEGIAGIFVPKKLHLWICIVISCIPATLIGIPFDDWIESHLSGYRMIAAMLILYGILFLVVEQVLKGRKPKIRTAEGIGFREALWIGIFQVLALIPGTSRSGATIIGGRLFGTSRRAIAEYTYFLGIPVMLGASLIKVLRFRGPITGTEVLYLIAGIAVAFVVSMLVIRRMIDYIRRHSFRVFGWYRIALGAVVLLVFGLLQ